MTARDDLINGLTEHACCFSEQDAKRMVNAFAHELAEQIRERRAQNEANSDPENVDAMRYRAGLTDAAYIIEGTFPDPMSTP